MQLHVRLWHICTLSVLKVKKSVLIFNKREMNVCGENGSRRQTCPVIWCSSRTILVSKAFYLLKFVTLTVLDYYFKDYFEP